MTPADRNRRTATSDEGDTGHPAGGTTPAYLSFLLALAGLPFVIVFTLLSHSEHQALREASELSRTISAVRSYYATNVAGRILAHPGPVTVTERYRDVPGGVPIPATLSIEIGEAVGEGASGDGSTFAFVSDAPFRNRSRPALDAFQSEALRSFRSDPRLQEFFRVERDLGRPDRLRFAIPVRMEAACVACHNSHPDSPVRSWKVGDVRGLQDVSVGVALGAQASESLVLGAYLLFFVGSALVAMREYRRGNRSLRELNASLAASRAALEQAAAQSRATAETQRAVLDTATSGIVLIGPDRRLQAANRRLHEIFDWPDGEMVGRSTRLWYPDEAGWQLGAEPYPTLWQGGPHSREQQLVRRDGSRFWARLTARAVDATDPSKGAVWVIDDITESRESALQLQQARDRAEASARAKSRFLANMSHEIRTPLNAILGMAYLGLRSDPPPRQRECLAKIESSGQQLLAVINDILDYSSLDTGRIQLERVPFDLGALLAKVLGTVAPQVRDKGLELGLRIADGTPRRCIGDALRIEQVLANLIGNALKFTEAGRIGVEVSAERPADAGRWRIQVDVSDSGIGIAAEDIARLFDGFEQLDGSSTRRYGGTGLGLVISRHLARMMEGDIRVDSTPGHGSRFGFSFRVSVDEHGSGPPEAVSQPAVEAIIAERERERGSGGVLAGAGSLSPVADDAPPESGRVMSAAGASSMDDDPTAPASGGAVESAPALARRLLELLDEGDMEVVDEVRAHRAVLRAWLGAGCVPLERAVEAFDFETAHAVLDAALDAGSDADPESGDDLDAESGPCNAG